MHRCGTTHSRSSHKQGVGFHSGSLTSFLASRADGIQGGADATEAVLPVLATAAPAPSALRARYAVPIRGIEVLVPCAARLTDAATTDTRQPSLGRRQAMVRNRTAPLGSLSIHSRILRQTRDMLHPGEGGIKAPPLRDGDTRYAENILSTRLLLCFI